MDALKWPLAGMLPREWRKCTMIMSAELIQSPVIGVIIHCEVLFFLIAIVPYKNLLLLLLPMRTPFPLRQTLVYRFPTQSEEYFLVQPLLKKAIRVLNGFPAAGTKMIDSFEHVA